MAGSQAKTLLFLDGDAGRHGAVAERLFNDIARKWGLAWQAVSRPMSLPADRADLPPAERCILLHAKVDPSQQHELMNRYPGRWESWLLEESPTAQARLEEQVHGLLSRLLGGSGTAPAVAAKEPAQTTPAKPAKPMTAKVGRETAGRRGKGVTTVFDLPLNETDMQHLAATLKQRCGTGGTVKEGRIEIQGDMRDRVCTELEKLGYKVKRVGG